MGLRVRGQARRRAVGSIRFGQPFPLCGEALEGRRLLAGDLLPLRTLADVQDFGLASITSPETTIMQPVFLEAGQTLTVVARGSLGLAPLVTVTSPGSVVLDTQQGNVNGVAFVQTVQADTSGEYTVGVSGANATLGSFELTVLTNAQVEAERYQGESNNTAGTSQDVSSSMLVVVPSESIWRGAVLGATAGSTDVDYYRFTLLDGEVSTLALESSSEGNVLELLDASGATRLAIARVSDDVPQVISRFVDATSDGQPTEYLARVTSSASFEAEYALMVTRGSDYEAGSNPDFASAQVATNVLGDLASQIETLTSLSTEFAGARFLDTSCNCEPPDTHGAAGPNHFIQVVNTVMTIYEKDGTIATGPVEFTHFFPPSLVMGQTFDFDPVVAYDEQIGRFIVGVLITSAPSSNDSDFLYAVSNSSDPTQGFSEQHRIDFSGISPNRLADYPKVGWNADAHVFSFNMFGVGNVNVDLLVIDKSTVLDANPATFAHRVMTSPNSFASVFDFTMAVATMHESAPGDPMWFVEEKTQNGGNQIRLVRMINVLSATPTFQNFDVSVTPYGRAIEAPQPIPFPVRTNDARMLNAEYRDGRLVATHGVGIGGRTLARWYEFDVTGSVPSLVQEANIDPGPGTFTYYPSIAINAAGDIGITYMQSSSQEFMSMYAVGHDSDSGPNAMSVPVLVKAGDTGYTGARGGDYSGISVDPVTDTFWATNEVSLISSQLWSTWVGEFSIDPAPEQDWYRFPVQAGDLLSIRSGTPFDAFVGPLEELLDPILSLFAPNGTLLATDDNSGGDNRNALVNHAATVSGDYRLRIQGVDGTIGAYLVQVQGATGPDAAPLVLGTLPSVGAVLASFPASLLVDFSESILTTSVMASAVTIGGLPVLSAMQVDANTIQVQIDPLANVGDGSYSVEITTGALSDLQGRVNSPFVGSFTLDTRGPRILATQWNGQPFPTNGLFDPGGLTISATFDEQLFHVSSPRRGLLTPGPEDLFLVEDVTGTTYLPNAISYDSLNFQFTANFNSIPEGNFTLHLVSGNGAFSDVVGNILDGEAVGTGDGVPTGNGIPGGDYLLSFIVDREATPLGVIPFQRMEPFGSLISVSGPNPGFLNYNDDQDPYQFFTQAGEKISVRAKPGNPQSTLVLDLDGVLVTAPGPGEAVLLEAWPVVTSELKTLNVNGDLASQYSLEVFRNANIVALSDNGSAVNLDSSYLPLGSGRFGAAGMADGSDGAPRFVRYHDPARFVDISATGTPLHLFDDGEATIVTTVGNALFPAGSVTVANNGGIIAGSGTELSYVHGPLPSSQFGTALLPFWTDLDSDSGNVFWSEQLVEGIPALIVQWNQRPHFANLGNGTFQIQLYSSGPVAARYVYPDLLFGDVTFNFGAGATVGYQSTSTNAVTYSVDTPSLSNGDVLDLLIEAPAIDVDEFEFDLDAGARVDVVLAGSGANFETSLLELLNPQGDVVATGTATPLGVPGEGFDQAMVDFQAATTGRYTVRLSTQQSGRYALEITRDLLADLEPNGLTAQPQRALQVGLGSLGYLESRPIHFSRFHDPTAFVDISATGSPLVVSDDGTATITSTIGNALFPPGAISVSNNGAIVAGSNVAVPYTNTPLPKLSMGRALFPWWDDLVSSTGGVYWQQTQVNGIDTLIVQWNHRPHYPNVGTATFQLQVFGSGFRPARFAYRDVDFGDPALNSGASATIGYQQDGSVFGQFSYNTPSVADGDVVDIFSTDGDVFQLFVPGGATVEVQTTTPLDDANGAPRNTLDPQISVFDPSGTLIALDTNSMPDGKNAALMFMASVEGHYLVEVSNESGSGEYTLHVVSLTMGDFDGDGDLDGVDVDLLAIEIARGSHNLTFDVTGDLVVDQDDLAEWVLDLRGTRFGDANLDGEVDGQDFNLWNAHRFAPNTTWTHGDFNADGISDGSDYGIWNANRFTSASRDSGIPIPWNAGMVAWMRADDIRTRPTARNIAPSVADAALEALEGSGPRNRRYALWERPFLRHFR